MEKEVIIIGAGPAGLFAADKLVNHNIKPIIIDERTYCGGSGAYTDGKLIFHPEVTMDLDELKITEDRARELMQYIDQKFLQHGAPSHSTGEKTQAAEELEKRAKKYGVRFILGKTRHIGSDKTPVVINNIKRELEEKGAEFIQYTKVNEIKKDQGKFHLFCEDLKTSEKKQIQCDYLIVGPGRGGAYWWREQAKKLGVDYQYGPIDVGVRVEIPAEVFKEVAEISYDTKFHYHTHCHNDKVRTFCVNPEGFVTLEPKENGIEVDGENLLPVNGHAFSSKKSANTNFAILSTIKMTVPDSDATDLGRRLIVSMYKNGGGKPVAQRWGDLVRGSRSWPQTFYDKNRGYDKVNPTLKFFTPGDISLGYYGRFLNNIKEMIIKLDMIIPGVAHPSTIIYAPEIKFHDNRYTTNSNMETTIPNLFVAGDGCGKSRGIVGAALSGILAAEGVIKR